MNRTLKKSILVLLVIVISMFGLVGVSGGTTIKYTKKVSTTQRTNAAKYFSGYVKSSTSSNNIFLAQAAYKKAGVNPSPGKTIKFANDWYKIMPNRGVSTYKNGDIIFVVNSKGVAVDNGMVVVQNSSTRDYWKVLGGAGMSNTVSKFKSTFTTGRYKGYRVINTRFN